LLNSNYELIVRQTVRTHLFHSLDPGVATPGMYLVCTHQCSMLTCTTAVEDIAAL